GGEHPAPVDAPLRLEPVEERAHEAHVALLVRGDVPPEPGGAEQADAVVPLGVHGDEALAARDVAEPVPPPEAPRAAADAGEGEAAGQRPARGPRRRVDDPAAFLAADDDRLALVALHGTGAAAAAGARLGRQRGRGVERRPLLAVGWRQLAAAGEGEDETGDRDAHHLARTATS